MPHSRPLGPPQYGLRTLLIVVSAAAVLLGLWQWLSPVTFAGVVLLILSVLAHVAGNAIGSRLRDGGLPAMTAPDPERPAPTLLDDHHFAPATKLSERHPLGWVPLVSAAIGFVIGAAGGAIGAAILLAKNFDWFAVILGAFAFGALGAFGGFLVVGFCKALGEAWHEAAREPKE
jgi:hypothetical protein